MKSIIGAGVLIVALLCSTLHATRAAAQAPGGIQNPQIEIAYAQPSNPAYQPIYERLKTLHVLEDFKQFMAPLRLPKTLAVRVDQCGVPTRPYQAQGPVTICYELIAQIEGVAAKAEAEWQKPIIIGTFVQILFHEVSHAVFDILQVPIWGRAEDAADNLAAFLMLQFGTDVALPTILGTAKFFELSGKTWTGSEFASLNSPEAQRYFNYLCMAYGSDKKTFEFLAKAEEGKLAELPEKRALACGREYATFLKFFDLRIMPYVDPDLLVTVRSMRWLSGG